MSANPAQRPTTADIIAHPILQKACVTGQAALTPEPENWLDQLLDRSQSPVRSHTDISADVEMM